MACQQLRRLLDLLGSALPQDVFVHAPGDVRARVTEDALNDLDRDIAASKREQAPCRASCRRITGRPHTLTCRSNSTVTRSGRSGVPSNLQKIRSWSL